MGTIEGLARQSGIIGIAFANLDLRQRMVIDETAHQFDEMRAALDAEHRALRTDALAEKMQDTARPAAEIDHAPARLDADLLELRIGIGRQIGDLALEARFFAFGAPQEIGIRLRHGTFPSATG